MNNHNKDIDKILRESYTKESFGGGIGLEAVREDPARHIQRTDKEGIFFMFTEILDNSIDESIEVLNMVKGLNPEKELEPLVIDVMLNQKEGTCFVEDHGRGITIETHERYDNLPTVVATFEHDNMGSKGKKSGVTKKGYSGKTMGTHGAGGFVVTACSDFMIIRTRIYNEEKGCVDIYEAEYRKGVPIESDDRISKRLRYIGEDRTVTSNGRSNTGLSVYFKPDLDIMSLYNPYTQQVDSEYFLLPQIRKRITDTLSTLNVPLVIRLVVDGVIEEYDSRNISFTYNKELHKDYLFMQLEPNEELRRKMDAERISDFYLDLMIFPAEEPTKRIEYIGFVNRIKVASSPHIDSLTYLINTQLRALCANDSDLRGFFRMDSLKGLRIIPLLYVEFAQWGGQVKTDYSDHRVANCMSEMLVNAKVMAEGGYFHSAIKYSFEVSKPYLMAEKSKSLEMQRVMEAQEAKASQAKKQKQMQERLNEDLRYLNIEGTFDFKSDIRYSDLALVEGRSAGGAFDAIMDKMPNLAVFSGMWGKVDNANKVERSTNRAITLEELKRITGQVSVLDKLDVLFSSPFRRYMIISDNDADGNHIRALMRFYIWKFHKRIIEEGRVFDVTPPYCDYTSSPGLKYIYKGEEKELSQKGSLRTVDEYEVVKRTYPGQVRFTLFKGVGSIAVGDLYRVLNDPVNWAQVPPLTPEEEYQLNMMFTDSSQFKKVFTEVNYLTDTAIRKERVKSTVYKDTTIKPEELYNYNAISTYPVFNSINRKSLEDYEEKGSSEIEMEYLKRQLQQIKEEWGLAY